MSEGMARPAGERRSAAPMPHADPDLAAVRAAQQDRAAFGALYRRYVDRVYAYAFYQLGDHHDAEDATGRAFTDAMRGISGYQPTGSTFRAWLFTIAHHTIVNARRHRARRRTVPMPTGFDRPAPNADPASLVDRADEVRAVFAAVRELPDDRRQVVLLRFVDGLSAAEIGEVLGRSAGAVRVLLHRALRDVAERVTD